MLSSRLAIVWPEFRQSCPLKCSVSRPKWDKAHVAVTKKFTITNIFNVVTQLQLVFCKTSPWSSGKLGAGRSRVRLAARSYQDLVNWSCSLLTRCTVCGRRAAGNTPRTQKETRNCTNSVVALQDQCSYAAPTTNHHIKKRVLQKYSAFSSISHKQK